MPDNKPVAIVNRLIATLPRRDQQRFLVECEPVELGFAEILAEPCERIHYAWFPSESFISLMAPLDQRTSLEVGLVGNEGMLGVSLILGVEVSPLHALVPGRYAVNLHAVLSLIASSSAICMSCFSRLHRRRSAPVSTSSRRAWPVGC